MSRPAGVLVILAMIVAAMPATVVGQVIDSYEARTCDFRRIGFDSIEVYALGAVGQPCKWTVERGIDFLDFLTVISPRGLEAAETIDTQPEVYVQIYRETSAGRVKVLDTTVEGLLMAQVSMPVLQNRDIVLIKQETLRKRRYLTFRNVTSVLGTFSTSLLLYLRLRDGRVR